MLDLDTFLKKYNIDRTEFDRCGLSWKDLQAIMARYDTLAPSLQPVATDIAARCAAMAKVHSVRSRIKDREHVAEKVVRKRLSGRNITIDNFDTELTDLIGVRALHLFKEDWSEIHKSIMGTWTVKEQPTAYHREGDLPAYLQAFRDAGCQVEVHKRGYRSVHYLVKTAPTSQEYVVEVQVRTLFEEGWSEIDHKTTYPYDLDNSLLVPLLAVFNRLASQADELGSYVTAVKRELESRQQAHDRRVKELEKALSAETLDRGELQKRLRVLEEVQKWWTLPFDNVTELGLPEFPLVSTTVQLMNAAEFHRRMGLGGSIDLARMNKIGIGGTRINAGVKSVGPGAAGPQETNLKKVNNAPGPTGPQGKSPKKVDGARGSVGPQAGNSKKADGAPAPVGPYGKNPKK